MYISIFWFCKRWQILLKNIYNFTLKKHFICEPRIPRIYMERRHKYGKWPLMDVPLNNWIYSTCKWEASFKRNNSPITSACKDSSIVVPTPNIFSSRSSPNTSIVVICVLVVVGFSQSKETIKRGNENLKASYLKG